MAGTQLEEGGRLTKQELRRIQDAEKEKVAKEKRRRKRDEHRLRKERAARDMEEMKAGICGPRMRLSFKSIVCNVLESVCIFLAISSATAGFVTYDWISTNKEAMKKVEIYPPINAPGFQTVACGLTSFCIDAAGELSQCSIPWPRYGDGGLINLDVYPSRVWAASAACIATGIFLMCLTWIYTLVACFGCFRFKVHRFFLRVLELGGVCLAAGLICFGFTLGDTGVSDDRCITRNGNGDCESWYATLPSTMIEGSNATCSFCPQSGQFQMSTSCSFGWGGLAVIIAVVLAGFANQFGSRVLPRKRQVKYKWVGSTKKKKKVRAGGGGGAAGGDTDVEDGLTDETIPIEHTGNRVVHTPPDIVHRLNEMDASAIGGGGDGRTSTGRDDDDGRFGTTFVNIIPNHLDKDDQKFNDDGGAPAPAPPPISSMPGRAPPVVEQGIYSTTAPVSHQPMYAEIEPDDYATSSSPPVLRKKSMKLADGDGLHEISDTDLTHRLGGGESLHETSETDLTDRILGGGSALNESSETDPAASPQPSPQRAGAGAEVGAGVIHEEAETSCAADAPPVAEMAAMAAAISALESGDDDATVTLYADRPAGEQRRSSVIEEASPIPNDEPGFSPPPAVEESDDHGHDREHAAGAPGGAASNAVLSPPVGAMSPAVTTDGISTPDAADENTEGGAATPTGILSPVSEVVSPPPSRSPTVDCPMEENPLYAGQLLASPPPEEPSGGNGTITAAAAAAAAASPPVVDSEEPSSAPSPPAPSDGDYEAPVAPSESLPSLPATLSDIDYEEPGDVPDDAMRSPLPMPADSDYEGPVVPASTAGQPAMIDCNSTPASPGGTADAANPSAHGSPDVRPPASSPRPLASPTTQQTSPSNRSPSSANFVSEAWL